MTRIGLKSTSFVFAVIASLAAFPSCGGASPPAAEPDEPSFDDGAETQQPSPKVQEAKDAIGRGEFAKAREILETAVAQSPADGQALFYLGVAYEGVEDPPKAIEAYKKAIASDQQLVDAYVNLSALLLDSENAVASADVAAQGLKIAPKHPDLLTNSALALEAANKTDEALSAYGRAVEASPENHELRFAYADLLARAKKPAQAKAQLKLVLDASSDVRVLAATGHLLATLESFADCVAAYDKALGVDKNPQLLVRRGLCRHELKDEAGAKKDFEAAIEKDPKDAPAHYYLGRHLAVSDKKAACVHLEKAAQLGEGGVAKSAKAAMKRAACK